MVTSSVNEVGHFLRPRKLMVGFQSIEDIA
jgi:hypothetical protein